MRTSAPPWSGAIPTRAPWPTWSAPAACGSVGRPTPITATSASASGRTGLATRLMAPETGPPEDLEPVSTVALRRFVKTHSVVHALPTAVSLRAFPAITFEGERKLAQQLVRSMILELCAFHGPDHVQVAVVTANPDGENWNWVKWLPHAQHAVTRDGMGSMRLLFPTLELLETSLSAELAERGRFSRNAPPTQGLKQLVVVLDDGYVTGDERLITDAGLDSVTVLDLNGPRDGAAAKRESATGSRTATTSAARTAVGIERFATPDPITLAEADTTARRIGRFRPGERRAHRQPGRRLTGGRPGLDGVAEDSRCR